MLVEFGFKNYKSFRDEAVLSMVASRDKQLEETHVVTLDAPKPLRLLRSAVLLGPNASGKSNVLGALLSLARLVASANPLTQDRYRLPVTPFKLDEGATAEPTEFSVILALDGMQVTYTICLTEKQILSESLQSKGTGRASMVFTRLEMADGETRIAWGRSLQRLGRQAETLLSPTTPLLACAAAVKIPVASNVVGWFKRCRPVVPAPQHGDELAFTLELASNSASFKAALDKWVSLADLGLLGVKLEEHDIPELDRANSVGLRPGYKVPVVMREGADERMKMVLPFFQHATAVGHGGPYLKLSEESAGTIKLLALAGPFLWALVNGGCLVADELDSRLHPHLRRVLLSLFHNPAFNRKGAQLIFTSHDAALLDSVPNSSPSETEPQVTDAERQIRRDQVWFTDKGRDGNSSLYRLWDFGPRKKESLRKAYLMGLYGAVPYLEPFEEATMEALGLASDENTGKRDW